MTAVADAPKKRRRDLATVLIVAVVVNIAASVSIGAITVNNSRDFNRRLAHQVTRQNAADKRAAARDVAATKSLALRVAVAAKLQSCVQVNKVKSGVISYIDGVSTRSLAATQATLASPTSTQDQKRTSLRNLFGALQSATVIKQAFKLDPSCIPKKKSP